MRNFERAALLRPRFSLNVAQQIAPDVRVFACAGLQRTVDESIFPTSTIDRGRAVSDLVADGGFA